MSHQAFGFRKSLYGLGEMEKSPIGDGLHADAFYKVGRRKSAAPARPTARRQNVIAPCGVIAERLGSPRTKKHGPRRPNSRKRLCSIFRKTKMFGGETIDEFARLFSRFRY